uniref:Uncharacterized protein n=1 Tax=Chromera velia CCMP2878 TaxID=1169474 RepID=A0A0G4I3F0_9ALVE|eukprot:Cvel_10597.t1-p1 / transcript=Cvel_10597.t1 / gene=Cvel_10597 / organism=Chromera_velia_CCMP2878 / gene_product=hypothetical protein / transcript_product=hypothetical protein / location=Cvel_scaffold643:1821-3159(+) / protein_length=216 / sequence_SO=supercontig / SO=protein_coding / is_pseudo=false
MPQPKIAACSEWGRPWSNFGRFYGVGRGVPPPPGFDDDDSEGPHLGGAGGRHGRPPRRAWTNGNLQGGGGRGGEGGDEESDKDGDGSAVKRDGSGCCGCMPFCGWCLLICISMFVLGLVAVAVLYFAFSYNMNPLRRRLFEEADGDLYRGLIENAGGAEEKGFLPKGEADRATIEVAMEEKNFRGDLLMYLQLLWGGGGTSQWVSALVGSLSLDVG